jgi:CDP-diacylglycerol--glycerol-3-phosphate 3-phosphatidyltransferase
MAQSQLWTPANAITASRLLVGPLCIWLLMEATTSSAWLALALMVTAELSDFIDGSVARWSARVTKFGKILDPMADCLYRDSVFIAFYINGWMPLWMLAIIIWRDLGVSYLREIAELGSQTLAARRSGKWKAVVQGVAQVTVVALLASGGPDVFARNDDLVFALLAVATFVTGYSLIDYAAGVSVMATGRDGRGLQLLSPANLVSLARIVLAPVILLLLALATRETIIAALILTGIAALSDVADGYIARRRGAGNEAGRYIDGAGDAIFNMAVFLGLLANGWLPASWFIAIYFAEVIVPYLGIFAKQAGRPLDIRLSARLKTAIHPLAQIVAIGAILGIGGPELSPLLLAASLGTAVAVSVLTLADHAVLTVFRGRQNLERPA